MMNPNGKVLDIHGIQALGEDVNIEETPSHPEKLFDIVRDLNNQKGRGAEIFAKRRKRSEKWVVEKNESQAATLNQSAPGTPWKGPGSNFPRIDQEADVKENSVLPPLVEPLPILTPPSYVPKSSTNNTCRPFYNPFTLDLTLSPAGPSTDGVKKEGGYQGPKLTSYQKLSNYNTAPRGWDQAHTYYRPITFGRPQESIVYSDF
ncbi:uncharacterized protein LOC105688593 [Athalia rosae]|uniref:uncharacterized protein LOC105688593 n=1 Tax=Athalia rosae TaxID=37344 RepID=UPI0020340A56|nr:uncharacterized protein LOC105688593 [Athalia rosae]